MSKYLRVQTELVSREDLRAALKAAAERLSFEFEEMPAGTETHLIGYQGDERPETATFVIRRKYVGGAANDLGYHFDGKGYVEVVSEYDSSQRRCTQIRQAIAQEYSAAYATRKARAKGFSVKRQEVGGTIQLIVSGRI